MAEERTEEAQRVIDALENVGQIDDPVKRALAISEVLGYFEENAKEMRELRRQVVLDLRAQKPAVSYRKIAAMLKVSLGTVQNIERGHGSAWGTKPRTKPTEG
jgi:DNA-binding transcriptional regulator YiaG